MALYEYITHVENIHRKRVAIETEERELTMPIITNIDKIGDIYNIYSDEIAKIGIKLHSIDGRRIFIFLVIRLFCPAVYTGSKLKRGIRDRIAEVIGCEASIISHDFRNLTFHYKKYRSFRNIVNAIYDSVMETLSEN